MTRTRQRSTRLGVAIALWMGLLLFGLVFAGVGLAVWSQSQPYADGILATGTVIDHQRSDGSDNSATWASVVEFETEQGETVTFVGSTFSSGRDPLGSDVRVSYRADDPFEARNLDDGGKTLGLIFAGVGSFVTVVAVIGAFLAAIRRLRARVSGSQAMELEQARAARATMEATGWDPSTTDFIGGEDRGF